MYSFWEKIDTPAYILAPMAGYTDSAFRGLAKQYGADIVYSEMISVDGICHGNKKTLSMFRHTSAEYPLVFQLFGSQPEKFARAAKIISKIIPNHPDKIGLDINFGCPAPKVNKSGGGAALMNEIQTAVEIINAVIKNTKLPVSIKIRTQAKNVDALTFLNRIKHLNWRAVMVHGRPLTQGFGGKVDFTTIKKIKQSFPQKIVIANGGIFSEKIAKSALLATQADGLGIARGAWGYPQIFNDLKNNRAKKYNWQNIRPAMLKHAKLFLKDNADIIPLRKHLVHYAKGLKNAAWLRRQLIKVCSYRELAQIPKNCEDESYNFHD